MLNMHFESELEELGIFSNFNTFKVIKKKKKSAIKFSVSTVDFYISDCLLH